MKSFGELTGTCNPENGDYAAGLPASLVIVELSTGKAILETFKYNTVENINLKRYKAVPIMEYLCGLNRSIKV